VKDVYVKPKTTYCGRSRVGDPTFPAVDLVGALRGGLLRSYEVANKLGAPFTSQTGGARLTRSTAATDTAVWLDVRRVRLMVAVLVEGPVLELLAELGWGIVDAYAERLGPTGTLGRDSFHDLVLASAPRCAAVAEPVGSGRGARGGVDGGH
jgi:hypothetical protein